MNILHVVESLDVGGLERVVVSLAREQRRRGHGVEVVCLFREGPLAAELRDDGIPVHCASKRAGLDAAAAGRLRALLRRARPHVLHTHNAAAHYYAVAASLGLGAVVRVNTRHGMGSFPYSRRREALYRVAMRFTRWSVAVCQAASENFKACGSTPPVKSTVVHNGIELTRFLPRNCDARDALLATLDLPAGAILFGTVGRLSPAKDHASLLEAMARLADIDTPAALAIVGDGALRGLLEDKVKQLGIERRVRMLGSRDDVPQLLSALDAFVLPSLTEGYSVALVEAAAAALPAIATRVGGNAEIVDDGHTGVLVPASDVDALATAMKTLAEQPSMREEMGRRARAWALESGSLATMADAYESLYAGASPQTSARSTPLPPPCAGAA